MVLTLPLLDGSSGRKSSSLGWGSGGDGVAVVCSVGRVVGVVLIGRQSRCGTSYSRRRHEQVFDPALNLMVVEEITERET